MESLVSMSLKSNRDIFNFLESIYQGHTVIESNIHPKDIIFDLLETPFCYLKLKNEETSYLAIGIDQPFKNHHHFSSDIDYVFGSLDFELDDKGFLFSPQVLIKFSKDNSAELLKSSIKLTELKKYIIGRQNYKRPVSKESKEEPNFSKWVKSVDDLKRKFDEDLFKVVLSRKKQFKLDTTCWKSALNLLMIDPPPSTYEYILFNGDELFYSISPETLYKKTKNKVTIDSIAGTTGRGKTELEDQDLFNKLIKNPKEIKEHKSVSDFIETIAAKLKLNIESRKGPLALKLKHVQHIFTQYNFTSKHVLNDSLLIDTLHPTPAVGGNNKKISKELIQKFETNLRGFYAAPSGFIDNKNGNSEFLVAIRSFLFKKDGTLDVFGGAGILIDSIPKKEWEETHNKMKNFLEKLNHE